MTNVSLTIKHPQKPNKQETSDFLVDSGAVYTVLPQSIVEKLKLKANFYREFTLADGKKVKRAIGNAIVQYGTEEITTTVVLGEKNDSALLGAVTLESFGFALDPFQRKIYKAKMML